MPKLLIASQNAHKIDEIKPLLEQAGFDVTDAREHKLDEPDETGDTFIENARIKAHAAAKATGMAVLADDSGLEMIDLGGAPGVHTKPFTDSKGGYQQAVDYFFEKIGKNVMPAQYYCCLVLCFPDGSEVVGEGVLRGSLYTAPKGENTFGYDPWFVPEGETRSCGEMDIEEKNKISHRSRAIQDLLQKLKARNDLRAVS